MPIDGMQVMTMKKILIAMQSPELSAQLEQSLCGQYHVLCCSDGLEAAEAITLFAPDIIVLDLYISGIDGVSLLELARDSGQKQQVLAVTPYISDYILRSLERLEVSCLIRTPCKSCHIAARILDLAAFQEEEAIPGREAGRVLASLGFKMNTLGFDIMLLALELYSKDPHQRITSQLYPAVAAACNGTVTQVEKAIRDSIESAWKERNEPIWRMYFTPARSGSIPKPTNGEFLARVSAQLSCRYDYKRLERKSS